MRSHGEGPERWLRLGAGWLGKCTWSIHAHPSLLSIKKTQAQLDEEEDGPDLEDEEELEVLTWEEEDELDVVAAALSNR